MKRVFMKNDILLIGSLNIDFTAYVDRIPEAGETISGSSFLMSCGGKGFNQAIAIARAGSSIYMLGSIGNDSLGDQLIEMLNKDEVHSLIKKTDESTGTAVIFVEKSGQNRITIFHGANYELTFDDVKKAIDYLDFKYICFQLENPIDVVEKGIKYAKAKGKIVILNPAPASKLNDDVFTYIDIFTPNEKELTFYTNGEKDLKKASQMILDKGVAHLVVTLGEKGAIYSNKNDSTLIPTYKVKAIDTVAAGDCFNGYLVSCLSKGMSMIESIKIANKASSIAVTRIGAAKSIPHFEELKNI